MKRVAWLKCDYPSGIQDFFDIYELDVQIDWMEHAWPALQKLQKEKYDAIVVDPYLAPGPCFQDETIERLLLSNVYTSIGLYAIEKIRSKGSANERTPIIVTKLRWDDRLRIGKFCQDGF